MITYPQIETFASQDFSGYPVVIVRTMTGYLKALEVGASEMNIAVFEHDDFDVALEPGWYYQRLSMGNLPDDDCCGPLRSKLQALEYALDGGRDVEIEFIPDLACVEELVDTHAFVGDTETVELILERYELAHCGFRSLFAPIESGSVWGSYEAVPDSSSLYRKVG